MFEPTEEQLTALRLLFQWELGDPSWASDVVYALKNPTETIKRIRKEMRD